MSGVSARMRGKEYNSRWWLRWVKLFHYFLWTALFRSIHYTFGVKRCAGTLQKSTEMVRRLIGPMKGVSMSGVNWKYCLLSGVDLEMRVSSVRLMLGVEWVRQISGYQFWVLARNKINFGLNVSQCPMKKCVGFQKKNHHGACWYRSICFRDAQKYSFPLESDKSHSNRFYLVFFSLLWRATRNRKSRINHRRYELATSNHKLRVESCTSS